MARTTVVTVVLSPASRVGGSTRTRLPGTGKCDALVRVLSARRVLDRGRPRWPSRRDARGTPERALVWAADLTPGLVFFPGFGSVCLGLTPSLNFILDSATGGPPIPPGGLFIAGLPVPASLPPGLLVYSQFIVLDASAPNGVAISNPASILLANPDTYIPVSNMMTSARGLAGATTFGGGRYVLLSGGGTGQLLGLIPLPTTNIYDNYTRTFSAGPTMAHERALHTSTLLPNGKILITGGIAQSSHNNFADGEVYDPATNTLTPVLNPMSSARAAHTATLLPNGQVLITGGNTQFATCVSGTPCCPNLPTFNTTLSTTDLYNPATNMFVPGPSMPAARAGHEAVTLPNGSILLAGGIVNGTCYMIPFIPPFALPNMATSAFVYNPATNNFATETGVTPGRLKPTVEVLPSGNVFFGGGVVLNLLAQALNSTSSVLIRNTSGSWSNGPSLPHAGGSGIAFPATAMQNGGLIISGGGTGNFGATTNQTPVATVYRFVEGAGYTALNPLPAARMNHTLTAMPDGTFLSAGGLNANATPVAVATADIWTP